MLITSDYTGASRRSVLRSASGRLGGRLLCAGARKAIFLGTALARVHAVGCVGALCTQDVFVQ